MLARSEQALTDAGRPGPLASRVGESISGTGMSRNLSRGSATLVFTSYTKENQQGFGAGIKVDQLCNEHLKLTGEVTAREIYDTYQAGFSWLTQKGFELSLLGQHLVSHNATPNNSSVSLQVNMLLDNRRYEEGYLANTKQVNNLMQWVATPVVKMNQVLVIAEQINKLLAPQIASINPNSGPFAGGNTVVITGSNFLSGAAVFFAGQLATSIQVMSPTLIRVVVPPFLTPLSSTLSEVVDVLVKNPDGQQILFAKGYKYIGTNDATASIRRVSPDNGSLAGGTTVIINGTNFTGTTAVSFGSTPATSFTVVSPTQITAVTPAHTAGVVDIAVTTAAGTTTANNAFTYVAASAPTIGTVSPDNGAVVGGTSVTIEGTNFTGTTAVSFGGAPATSFTADSPTQITAVTPTHAAGIVDVAVTTAVGTTTANNAFTYVAASAPTIGTVSPDNGAVVGGTSVTIEGTNFTGTTAVSFGGTPATSFTVDSPTQITVVTPAHTAGIVDVAVTTAAGTTTSTGAFTYGASPVITTINPVRGPLAGGQTITIGGTNLTGTTTVTLDGISATNVTVVNSMQVTAVTPAHAAGTVNVVLVTPNGNATITNGYTYVAPPTISTVQPNAGSSTGGTTILITGTNLNGTTAVNFGGTPGTSITQVSPTQMTVVTPAHAVGTVNVAVITAGGAVTATNAYTYLRLNSCSATAPIAGIQLLTCLGVNLNLLSQTFLKVNADAGCAVNPQVISVPNILGLGTQLNLGGNLVGCNVNLCNNSTCSIAGINTNPVNVTAII